MIYVEKRRKVTEICDSVVPVKTRLHVLNCTFRTRRNSYSRFVEDVYNLTSACSFKPPFQELQSMNIAARVYTVWTGRVRDSP